MKFFAKQFALALIILTLTFGSFAVLFARADDPPKGVSLKDTGFEYPNNLPKLDIEGEKNPIKATETLLLNYVINPIFFIAGGIAIYMVVNAGFSLVISGVAESQLETAKKTLIWSGAGLLLIIGSYTLVRAILEFVLISFQVVPLP